MNLYWNGQWQQEDVYKASWADKWARRLELRLILAGLNKYRPCTVVEYGCGPFTLGESPAIYEYLKGHSYMGVDSSETAIARAREQFREGNFRCKDIDSSFLQSGDFVIVRRTVQNIETEAVRKDFLQKLSLYEHGIVIEGCEAGLARLNAIRVHHDLSVLISPDFNHYLTNKEVAYLEVDGATADNFLSTYYRFTRGQRNLRDWDSDDNYNAYLECKYANEGNLGPVMAWTW